MIVVLEEFVTLVAPLGEVTAMVEVLITLVTLLGRVAIGITDSIETSSALTKAG